MNDSPVVPSKQTTAVSASITARPPKRKMGIPPIRRMSEDARPLSHVELDIHRKIIQSHTSPPVPSTQQPSAVNRISVLPEDRAVALNLASARTLARMRLGLSQTHPSSTTRSSSEIPSTPAVFPTTALAYPNPHNYSSVVATIRHEIPQTPNPTQHLYHPALYRPDSRRLITRSHSQPARPARSASSTASFTLSHTSIRPSVSNPLVPASLLVNSNRVSTSARSRDRSSNNTTNQPYSSDNS